MQNDSILVLAGSDGYRGDLLGSQQCVPYNPDEQKLSVFVQGELDQLMVGGRGHLILLKLYPESTDRAAVSIGRSGLNSKAVRREMAARIAADALNFFGPLHGGVVTQETLKELILQRQKFSTAYPHISLERYDFYDAFTCEPLLVAWRASRIQNLRRETRTNRMIDLALLAVEVSKSVFPRLLS